VATGLLAASASEVQKLQVDDVAAGYFPVERRRSMVVC
jgi:hypothetical protein